jgi:hypothetical protein
MLRLLDGRVVPHLDTPMYPSDTAEVRIGGRWQAIVKALVGSLTHDQIVSMTT